MKLYYEEQISELQKKRDSALKGLRDAQTKLHNSKSKDKKEIQLLEKSEIKKRQHFINCQRDLFYMQWLKDGSHTDIMHYKGSIKAIKKVEYPEDERKRPTRYFALIQKENGKQFTREVEHTFLSEHIDQSFMDYLHLNHKEKGWFCLESNDQMETIKENNLKDLKDEYFYSRIPNSKIIGFIKFEHLFEYEKDKKGNTIKDDDGNLVLKLRKQEISVKVCGDLKYYVVKKPELENITGPVWLSEAELKASHQMIKEIRMGGREGMNLVAVDKADTKFFPEDVGKIHKPQIIHFYVKSEKFHWNFNTNQISRIKYNPIKDEWLGVEARDPKDAKTKESKRSGVIVVKLTQQWVAENFSENQIAYFKSKAEADKNKFLEVPVAAKIEIYPTMDISKNPYLTYTQNEHGICAFASFASVLYLTKGFKKEAELVMKWSKDIDKTKLDYSRNILEMIVELIHRYKEFTYFRRKYTIKKIDKSHDILNPTHSSEHDIKLVVLVQSDCHMSHAVTIAKNYIFDCNAKNALPLSVEGLDTCCGRGATFVSIKKGYWFQRK